MLSMGATDAEMADHVIEQGWCPDVKDQTVLRNINRWRKGSGQQALIKLAADKMLDNAGKMVRHIDTVSELEQLVIKQKARLEKVMKNEDTSPLLLGMVSDEMKNLMQLLDKLAQQQAAFGIRRKVKVGETDEDYAEFEEVTEEAGEATFTEEDRRTLELIRQEVPGLGGD